MLTHLIATVACLFSQAPQANLHYAPMPGLVQFYDITTTTKMMIDPEKSPHRSNTTVLKLRCRVEVVAADERTFTAQIRWVRSEGRVGLPLMGRVRFDSQKENDNESLLGGIRAPWMALAGFEYHVILDRYGEIVSLPRVSPVLSEKRKEVRKGPNPRMVLGLLDEPALRSQVRALFPLYSRDSVPVGGSWSVLLDEQIGNSQSIRFSSVNQSQLTELAKGCARLRVDISSEDVGSSDGNTLTRNQVCEVNTSHGMLTSGTMNAEISKTSRKLFFGKTRFKVKYESVVEPAKVGSD